MELSLGPKNASLSSFSLNAARGGKKKKYGREGTMVHKQKMFCDSRYKRKKSRSHTKNRRGQRNMGQIERMGYKCLREIDEGKK